MTRDRWRRVEEIYHEASEKSPDERAEFLDSHSSQDESLRQEVEELLQQSESTSNILDRPVQQLLDQPELEAGQQLGPYRILGLIGTGGMGRVYKAFDTRLGRAVAIKLLRAGFTGRFRREARAVAALNHPHICTLYDLGPNYLVMEYVEGAPVKGPIPLAQALKTAIAIAGALEAAHSKGVIHRDLKPANILLTESGPKLLDFGLAKLEPTPGAVPESVSWVTTAHTTIAGTIQYMSPEQLQGRGADARSDIFSFGLVLFEMLTGHVAFDADNPASLIAAILTSQPQPLRGAPKLPSDVQRLINRAIEKDPDKRWQTARELREALETILVAHTPLPTRRLRMPWLVAAGFAMASVGLAWYQWGPDLRARLVLASTDVSSRAPQMMLFNRKGKLLGAVGAPADYSNPAISPDGRRVAVSVRDSTRNRGIWLFDIIKGGQTQFTNYPSDETNPVWSPDGSEIAFCSDRQGRRDIYAKTVTGDKERLLLASAGNKNPLDWARDGSALYFNTDRNGGGHDVALMPLTGNDRSPRVFLTGNPTFDWLELSPDSRLSLYRIGSTSGSQLRVRSMAGNSIESHIGGLGTMEGHWKNDGSEFYFISGDTMIAQSVQVNGSEIRLGTPERLFRVPAPNTFGRNMFAVTPDGERFLVRTGR